MIEIIRCKDCVEWRMRSGIKKNYCTEMECIVEEDDFCSHAERNKYKRIMIKKATKKVNNG